MSEYLTIDVGGTAVKYALMNEEAEIAEKGEVATPHDSQEEFINLVVGLYQKYQDRVEGIAMSAPGRIDASRGYFYTSGALGYLDHTDFAALLADKVKVPFRLENDAKSAALAELWKGSMQGVANGTVITLGTGIGGAIIINGKLYRGSTFAAGEYSPISTRLDLPFDTKYMWANQNSVGSLIRKYAELSGQDASQAGTGCTAVVLPGPCRRAADDSDHPGCRKSCDRRRYFQTAFTAENTAGYNREDGSTLSCLYAILTAGNRCLHLWQ